MTAVLEATTRPTTADERDGCICGRRPCPDPVVVQIVAICEHEHVRVGRMCERHFIKLGKGGVICRECDEHPAQPHRCYIRGAQS